MADDKLSFTFVHTTADHKKAVKVTRIRHPATGFDALAYRCSLREDIDGAPRAYGLANPTPVEAAANPDTTHQRDIKRRDRTGKTPPDDRTALDTLGNATSPYRHFDAGNTDFAWVGLYAAPPEVARRNGFSIDQRTFLGARRRPRRAGEAEMKGYGNTIPLGPKESSWYPAIQGANAPAPGFFVSTSAVVTDASRREWDQLRYVDAQSIPFAVLTPWLRSFGVTLGDFGMAINPLTGNASGFVFADAGFGNKVGEVSTRLLSALGGDDEANYVFLVFPGSGPPITAVLKYQLGAISQLAAFACIRKLNAVPDPESVVLFLAFEADLAKFNAFQQRSLKDHQSVEADGLYLRYGSGIERALERYGMEPF